MGKNVAPGVYVSEIDQTQYVGAGSPTIVGVVGYAEKGTPFEIETVTNFADFRKKYGTAQSYLTYAAMFFFRSGGTQLKVVRATNNAQIAAALIKYDSVNTEWIVIPQSDSSFPTEYNITDSVNYATPSGTDEKLLIYAKNPGTWGNNLSVKVVSKAAFDASPSTYMKYTDGSIPDNTYFLFIVYENEEVVDYFVGSTSPNAVDAFGNSLFIPEVASRSEYVAITISPDFVNAAVSDNVEVVAALDSGSNGDLSLPTSKINQGYNLFQDKVNIDIDILASIGNTTVEVLNNIASIVDGRGDCFAILDIPFGMSVDEAITFRTTTANINTSYAAFYYNWLKFFDPENNVNVYIPPTAAIVGVYAKNDLSGEYWFAPAGSTRGSILNVIDLENDLSEGDIEQLYANQINPIVSYPGVGITVWGQKTATYNMSAFSRINIRRLLIKIKKDLSAALKQFVFEQNDSFTRARVKLAIDPYLRDIKSRRGIEDFKVVCDESNNTSDVIAQNKLIVDTYIKPIFAIDYINVRITVTKEDVDVLLKQ